MTNTTNSANKADTRNPATSTSGSELQRQSDELIIRERREAAEGIVELTLQRPDGSRLPDWSPGAHIDLIMPSGTNRQYSLCGDRWDAHSYRIAIQREIAGTGGSVEIHKTATVGTSVRFGGPRNNFHLAPAPQYVFIAGGIGITAILPMIDQAERMDVPWRLLYLGREVSRMAYHTVKASHPSRVSVHNTNHAPRISIGGWLGEVDPSTMVYACGPQSLLEALPSECSKLRPERIRTEKFTNDQLAYASINTDPYDVVLSRSGMTVRAEGHQSVAEALVESGVPLITSCSRGVCGTCELAVLEGEVDHRDTILDDDERAGGNCMFPCVSRAANERLVVDL